MRGNWKNKHGFSTHSQTAVAYFSQTKPHLQGGEGYVIHGAPGAHICADLARGELGGQHLGVNAQERRGKVHIRLICRHRAATVGLLERDVTLHTTGWARKVGVNIDAGCMDITRRGEEGERNPKKRGRARGKGKEKGYMNKGNFTFWLRGLVVTTNATKNEHGL